MSVPSRTPERASRSDPFPAVPRGWFDGEDRPTRADLETCIHCGLCLTACPTYRELKIEPDSPRGRIYLMRGLAEGRIAPSPELVGHLDLCLGCRACETVCPAGVPYGRMLEETRGQLARRSGPVGLPGLAARWVLTRVLPHRGSVRLVTDLLRMGQTAPARALLGSGIARRLLPRFVIQGFEMTPRLEPRGARALERVAAALPRGARLEKLRDRLVFHPAGAARARVGLFTTCVMEAMFPRVNRETVRLLVLAGCEVAVPRGQTCCGALQAHAGLRRVAKRLTRRNVAVFREAYDFVVTGSAGCGAALREAGHLLRQDRHADEGARFGGRVRDVSEVLDRLGLPPPAQLASRRGAGRPLRIGYHDPCHLAHAQGVRKEPRALLARLPGAELVEIPNADWCCGSAGVYNLTHPEMAVAQLQRKLDAIVAADPELVVASNPGCLLHMSRGARERGLDVPIVHLVEVLGMAHPAPGSAP